MNESDWAVRLTKLQSSCGCTTADAPVKPIPPHANAIIHTKIQWAGRVGLQSSRVIVLTDEPGETPLVLTVTGWVLNPVLVSPTNLSFGSLEPGLSEPQFLEINRGSELRPFTVTNVTCDDSRIVIESDRPLHDAGVGRFSVRVRSPRLAGECSTVVVVRTDLAELPELRIPITAHFRGALEAAPSSVIFSGRNAATPAIVRVMGGEIGQPVSLFVVGSEEARSAFAVRIIETRLKQTGSHASVQLEITARQDTSSSVIRTAKVRVACGSDSLEIPVVSMPTGDSH